jgi:hypothetical protein
MVAVAVLLVPGKADAALQRGPNNLSLTGYWNFDEGTSTTVGDLSGNGNTLTLRGNAAWGRGKRGSAFNASLLDAQAFGVLQNGGATNGAQTINLWYRVPAGLSARSALLTVRNAVPSTAGHHMMVYPTTNSIGVELWGGGFVMQASTTGTTAQDNWRMMTFTFDGGTAYRLYDNGTLVSSTNTLSLASSLIQELVVSGYSTSTTDGQVPAGTGLDDIRIYRRALSAQEINNLYRIGGTPRKTISNQGLLAYLPMDEATSTTVGDMSGNGRNGTLVNGPTWINGRRGGALNCDGGDDEVQINGGDIGATSVTVGGWVYVESAIEQTFGAVGGATIFNTRDANLNLSPSLVVSPSDGGAGTHLGLIFTADSDAIALGAKGVTTIQTGRWYHMVGTFNRTGSGSFQGDWDVYLNGVKDNASANNFLLAGSIGGGALFSGSPWRLCNNMQWIGTSDIWLDDMRIYNRVLSADEIRTWAQQSDYLRLNSTPTRTVTSGLVGYWPFDGRFMNWSTNRVVDASGGNNNALLTNMSTTTTPMIGKVGQALNFDGSNDFIDVGSPTNLDDLGSMSVCAWIFPERMPIGYSGIASKSSGSTNGWQFYLYDSGGAPPSLGFFNTDGDAVERVNAVPLRSWQHVCGTWDGNAGLAGRKLYLNGIEMGSTVLNDYGSGASDSSYNLEIGTLGSASYLFPGGIDDVRVYDRELTAAEVRRIFNAGQ